MILTLRRIAKKKSYTIGHLYVDGEYFCDTIEDTDRGLMQGQSIEVLRRMKVKSNTAIPKGRYKVTLDVVSPKFRTYKTYDSIGGKLPRLIDVPAFDGILIHIGNTENDTDGCILVGENKIVGKVINSRVTFFRLYEKMSDAKDDIFIEIT